MNFARVLHQDTPSTREAASRDLAKKACKKTLGEDKAGALLSDKTKNGKQLVEYAVNLLLLEKKLGDAEPSYVEARAQFKKAVDAYIDKGEKGYSSTCNVGSSEGKRLDDKIKGAIDKLVAENPSVFDTAADVMYQMYLYKGLPKAQGGRLGLKLDEQSMKNSSHYGNASEAASGALLDSLKLHAQEGGSEGLTCFVSAMLGQLDLGADQIHQEEPKAAAPRAVRSDGGRGGEAVRDISQIGGGASIGGININVNVESQITPLIEEVAALRKEVAALHEVLLRGGNKPLMGTVSGDPGAVIQQLSDRLNHSPVEPDALSQEPLSNSQGESDEQVGLRSDGAVALKSPGPRREIPAAPPLPPPDGRWHLNLALVGRTSPLSRARSRVLKAPPPQLPHYHLKAIA
ncbi:hypothetical protein [Pseudomonas chlororaphis]|uniref:hypothetical protein n=1 Tax=Pseudomonas chlororaphis TaxID=587753 RepID=UPI000F57B3FD|nr:hypothetical protein [Pseudomonas chlororaphis]